MYQMNSYVEHTVYFYYCEPLDTTHSKCDKAFLNFIDFLTMSLLPFHSFSTTLPLYDIDSSYTFVCSLHDIIAAYYIVWKQYQSSFHTRRLRIFIKHTVKSFQASTTGWFYVSVKKWGIHRHIGSNDRWHDVTDNYFKLITRLRDLGPGTISLLCMYYRLLTRCR